MPICGAATWGWPEEMGGTPDISQVTPADRRRSPVRVHTKHQKAQQQACTHALKPICKITGIRDFFLFFFCKDNMFIAG